MLTPTRNEASRHETAYQSDMSTMEPTLHDLESSLEIRR